MKKRKNLLRVLSFFVIFAMAVGTLTVTSADSIAKKGKKSSKGDNNIKAVKVTNVKKNKLALGKNGKKKQFKLKASVILKNKSKKSNKKVVFSSSNKKVAKVSKSGKIKAKNGGIAKITAAAAGNKNVKTVITVTVTSVRLNKSSYEFDITLYDDEENDDSEYEEDEDIVIERKIIKNDTDDSEDDSEYDDVYEDEEEDEEEEEEEDESYIYQLKASVFPKSSSKKIKWVSSDEDVATVNSKGVVTAEGEGDCVIRAIATDGSGAYASCDITVIDDTWYDDEDEESEEDEWEEEEEEE